MDPSHFRGSQPPTSHVVPGAPGAPGYPPHFGFIEPPFVIPAAFLTDIVTAIRNESATQNRLLTNHYSNTKQDYNAIKEDFRSCVHQTDRILAEQHARFELRLEGIHKGVRQFHESQMAAIAGLVARLDVLEGSANTSSGALTSEIATVVETMERRFDGLTAMIKNEDVSSFRDGMPSYGSSLEAFPNFPKLPDDPLYAANMGSMREVLVPATWSQTDSELDISNPERGELYEGDIFLTPTPTDEPPAPPTVDASDSTTAPPLPPTTPTETIHITPSADYEPLQDPPSQDLFDAPSPLTPMSTPCSQNHEEPQVPIASPEIEIPAPHPTSADTTPRKRKRKSQGHGALKRSRRNKKSRPQGKPEVISYEVQQPEGNHVDPLVWPPVIEGGPSDQMYVQCDRCQKWFHFGCVGLRADREDESPWECPLCVRYPTRNAGNVPRGGGMCSRPGCAGSEIQEYFMDRLLGRCYVPDQDVVKYLVAYEGYDLDQCTWESPDSFSNDPSRINDFLEWWATENPGVDVESLDPHETIFLDDARVLARTGFTWLGA